MRLSFILESVWTGIRRNLTMTIALVLSTAIALAFVGASLLASSEITQFRSDYEGELNVSVFLCATPDTGRGTCEARPVLKDGKQVVIDGVKQTDASITAGQLKSLDQKLSADPLVTDHSYVSPAQQLARAKKILPKSDTDGLQVGDIGASYTVKLKDIKKDYAAFVKEYSGVPGVRATTNAQSAIRSLLDVIDGTRILAIVIAIVVLIASILLIANTIQVAAAQRRNETNIMRLVGASRWMTELPFLLETAVAAFVGGVIGGVMVWLGKSYVLNDLFAQQTDNGVIPDLSTNTLLVAVLLSLVGGILVSALTAFVTLRLYVKL